MKSGRGQENVQSWPKVLAVTQILCFANVAASVFVVAIHSFYDIVQSDQVHFN